MNRGRPGARRSGRSNRSLSLVTLALAGLTAATLAPFWVSLVLAAWIAGLLQPAVARLQRLLHGRRRGATAIVVLALVAALLPFAGLVPALALGVRDLLLQARAAIEGDRTLSSVLLGGETRLALPTPPQWTELATRYGASAWRTLAVVVRASTSALLESLVFVVALFVFASEGVRGYAWLARSSPLPPRALGRLVRAFHETGRGLLVGTGGTALVQGLVATLAYVGMGIPRAMLLGPLTAVCALVPAIGTGLVWIPLAVGLGATGQWVRATLVVAVGVGVHTLVDNFIRPVLTRYGHLRLPTAVVMVSILGGVAAFGASGALLGPLAVRLLVESLRLRRIGGVA